MNIRIAARDLARHYAKFWVQGTSGWNLSDNAPTELYKLLYSLPPAVDREAFRAALFAIATRQDVELPTTAALFRWFADHPGAERSVNRVLTYRKPPQTIKALLAKAYELESDEAKELVLRFLNQQLDNY